MYSVAQQKSLMSPAKPAIPARINRLNKNRLLFYLVKLYILFNRLMSTVLYHLDGEYKDVYIYCSSQSRERKPAVITPRYVDKRMKT